MLSVIIPTINEGSNLKILLPKVKNNCDEIVIVDDGSVDDTLEIARKFGCIIIERGKRSGIGTAVHCGVKEAHGDIVAIMDGDDSHPVEALRSVNLIELDVVDIIKLSRFIPGGGMADKRRESLLGIYNKLFSLISFINVHDFTGGYVIAKKETFNFNSTAINGEWVAEYMLHNRKRRIAEIPYVYKCRLKGQSKFAKLKDIERVYRYIYYLIKYRIKGI